MMTPARWWMAVAAMCLLAFGYFEYLAINQWMTGRWYLTDVGNIQYVMVNSWHGDFLYSPFNPGNFFASHFSPILLLISPIIWLSKYPIPLITLYCLALALTPVPLYVLARQRGLPAVVGLALGFWFLGNHFTGSLLLSNHFESFYVLGFLTVMALYGIPRRRGLFWLAVVLTLAVKEDAALWLLAFAVWKWVFERRDPAPPNRALRLAALCVAWGLVAGGTIMLMAAAQPDAGNASFYLERMGGMSLAADNLSVLGLLVLSAGGLCLLHWRAALLLLVPLPVILGNFPFTRHLLYYYSYPFLPFLAFATVCGAAALHGWLARRPGLAHRGGAAIATLLVIIGAVQWALPTRTDGLRRVPHKVTHRDNLRRQIAASDVVQPPLAVQSGLWGVTPWKPGTVWLSERHLTDEHYVFMDLKGMHGLGGEEFIRVFEKLREQMESGARTTLLDQHDFIVLSPVNPD